MSGMIIYSVHGSPYVGAGLPTLEEEGLPYGKLLEHAAAAARRGS
jgi:hypothetical protein